MKTNKTNKKYFYSKKNITIKKRNKIISTNKINIIHNIISLDDNVKLKKIISSFFENQILQKIQNCKRPITEVYGDFVERRKGRFEIIPPKQIQTKIWQILYKNNKFINANKQIKNIIKKNYKQCVEELGILPVEPHTENGTWHRDIFVNNPENDFEKPTFYITQIIYLDDKSNTEFCLQSQNNPDDNSTIYKKIKSEAIPSSSIIFDGRTIHKGLKNDSNKIRYAIYISYYSSSYVEQESIKDKILYKKDKIC